MLILHAMVGNRLLIFLMVMLGGALFPGPARGQTNTPLSSVHAISKDTRFNSLVRLHGTITFIDRSRNLIVLQDGVDAVALVAPDLMNRGLSVGEWIELDGRIGPLVSALPGFPESPDHRETLHSFETPSDIGDYFLSRLQGFLHPPVSGNYTFWIASDDASELWLSDSEAAGRARKIAQVDQGRWTEPRQWTRFPLQQSRRIRLEAGKAYYIEALGQEINGHDSLAVAWRGPGFERTVIEGKYLSPLSDRGNDMLSSANGVRWENWTNFYSSDFSVLRIADKHILSCTDAHIVNRQAGKMPEPMQIPIGQPINSQASYRFVALEGRVKFLSQLKDGWLLDLSHGNSQVSVRIKSEGMPEGVIPNGSLIRVLGVFEPVKGDETSSVSGKIWVNSNEDIAWLHTEDNWSLLEPMAQRHLAASNTELSAGRIIRAQGRVVAEEAPNVWLLEGKDTFQGYTSSDGTNWLPVGPPIEMSLSNKVLAGFAIASHQTGELASVEFDDVAGLTSALSGVDIGDPPLPGLLSVGPDEFRVSGSGDDIWNEADQCFFGYQAKTGSIQMSAHLAKLAASDRSAKVVLMVRESLSSNSPWAGLAVMPEERVGLQARLGRGESAVGEIASHPGSWVKLVRQRNSFLIRVPGGALKSGQALDVLGEVQWRGQRLVLNNARTRFLPEEADVIPIVASPEQASGEVHTVQIAELESEAKKAQRVPYPLTWRIRGVTTFNGPIGEEWYSFVQDSSGGARIQCKTEAMRRAFRVGDWVDMTGTLVTSGSASTFVANGVACLGGGEMPEPVQLPVDLQEKASALGEWTELEGVVRAVAPDGTLWVMSRAGLLEVNARALPTARLETWVNALVRMRGVLWRSRNPVLLLPAGRFVDILEAPPKDPFSIPSFPIHSLWTNASLPPLVRRMKVSGVVTCRRDDFMMLQDESGGARLETPTGPNVKIGEHIEAVGFPSRRGIGLVLSDALLRSVGEGAPPTAIELSSDDIARPQNNGMLVSVEAVLLAQHSAGGIQTLDVQSGQRAFRASMPLAEGEVPRLAPGTRLKLTGVAVVEGAETALLDMSARQNSLLGSLELLLRRPRDLVIVERPPWWNWKYTAASSVVVVLAFLVALLWIRTLHKQVEERTIELRETMGKLQKEARISATLAERDRLAAEIHDSVEQGLSAIIMQMEAATMVDDLREVKRHVTMARNMAGFSRAEVQHAVWDLQSPLLENADLPTALRRVAGDISAGDAPHVELEIAGSVFQLPSAVEHHLLRIAQEAITNAVKHGEPQTISVTLRYTSDALTLTVRDDGVGFIPETTSIHGGHFGLQGMRTRAQKIDARLMLASQPGEGTSVQIIVPRESGAALEEPAQLRNH